MSRRGEETSAAISRRTEKGNAQPEYLGSMMALMAELDMRGPYFFAPR